MQNQQASVDVEIFAQTASLFAAKREALPEEAVAAVANEIVRRLAASKSREPHFELPSIPRASIEAFCDALTSPDPIAALRFIQDRRAEGLSRQGVYLGYITEGARCLGERWEADQLSFLQVTCGTGHLYALMRALRSESSAGLRNLDRCRTAMFATVPGEDHGIGITVATDLFRDAGWDIDLAIGANHETLMARIEEAEPQIIGLSLSTEQRLVALVRLVVAVRLVSPGVVIGVAPGSSVDAKRLRDLVDIDLVFTDAPSAIRELERLIQLRG